MITKLGGEQKKEDMMKIIKEDSRLSSDDEKKFNQQVWDMKLSQEAPLLYSHKSTDCSKTTWPTSMVTD